MCSHKLIKQIFDYYTEIPNMNQRYIQSGRSLQRMVFSEYDGPKGCLLWVLKVPSLQVWLILQVQYVLFKCWIQGIPRSSFTFTWRVAHQPPPLVVLFKDVGTTINLLITNRILTEDELLGIEHFIGEASFEKLKLKKHEHVDLVLSPQMRMREKD